MKHKTRCKSGIKNCLTPVFKGLIFLGLAIFIVTSVSFADEGAKKKAEVVGMSTCETCHEKYVKDFNHSVHSRIVVPTIDETIDAQGCEACHGAGSLHVDASDEEKKTTIINPGKNPEACYKCHQKQKGEFSLQYHHPLPEGKMSCTSCHDPHSEDSVRPGATASLVDVNETCAKCHKDQTSPMVFEHAALREGCIECHNAHGSINKKMLKQRDANLCLKCHYQTNYPMIGDYSSPTGHQNNIPPGPCWSGGCHTAPHGSNYNEHLRI